MKKACLFVLVSLLLLVGASAVAESDASVYSILVSLMNERQFTLTVSAEGTDAVAEKIAEYGKITCTLRQEKGRIILNGVCEGDAYLTAVATPEDIRIETNLIENGSMAFDWASLLPNASMTVDEKGAKTVSARMTGPDHEMIDFTCKVLASDLTDYQVEIRIGYITGPGNVHSLWDGLVHQDGEASREFYFTFSEDELDIVGDGAETAETAEDGTITITRDETYLVTFDEEEQGELTIHAQLVIQ